MTSKLHTQRSRLGSVLTSVLILVIVIGIFSASMLMIAQIASVSDANMTRQQELERTALYALELMRTQMHFDSPGEFYTYIEEPPAYPKALTDNSGRCFLNRCQIQWSAEAIEEFPEYVRTIVKASRGDETYGVQQILKIPDLSEYSFASNYMHDGYRLGTPQNWYGRLYWHSEDGSVIPFDDLQTFWGELSSWDFGNRQGTYGDDYRFMDDDGVMYPAVLEEMAHTEYTYSNPIERDQFKPFDANIDLDVLFDRKEIGSFQQIATVAFDSGQAHGRGEEARPKAVEIFYGPDGYIYWRHMGAEAGDWNLVRDDDGAPIPQDGTVIYVEREAYIRGVITGRTTIASSEDISIVGNIIRQDNTQAVLGIMAYDDIYWENRVQNPGSGKRDDIAAVIDNDQGNSSTSWSTAWNTLYNRGRGNIGNVHYEGLGCPSFVPNPVWDETNPDNNTYPMQNWPVLYPELAQQWEYWNGEYAGNVPPHTVLDASFYAGDTMGPAVPYYFGQYIGDEWMRQYHDPRYPGGTSWRCSGTYFMGGDWPDFVENWNTATYDEHPFGDTVRPPAFARLTNGSPAVVAGSIGRLN